LQQSSHQDFVNRVSEKPRNADLFQEIVCPKPDERCPGKCISSGRRAYIPNRRRPGQWFYEIRIYRHLRDRSRERPC
jgi:hypothetical protein